MEMFDKKNELNSPNFVVRLVLFCFLIFHLKVSFSFAQFQGSTCLISAFLSNITLWMYQRVTWGQDLAKVSYSQPKLLMVNQFKNTIPIILFKLTSNTLVSLIYLDFILEYTHHFSIEVVTVILLGQTYNIYVSIMCFLRHHAVTLLIRQQQHKSLLHQSKT